MLQRNDLWELIAPLVEELGLKLFDIDLPSSQGGTLRITIAHEEVQKAIGVDDCALVSKKLSALDRFEDILPSNVVLEVSSPGLNRKLRTEDHFRGAVGEHLKIKAFNQDNKKETFMGTLCSFQGDVLEFQLDKTETKMEIPFSDVLEARVDYIFD